MTSQGLHSARHRPQIYVSNLGVVMPPVSTPGSSTKMAKNVQRATLEDIPRIREMAFPVFTESYKDILTPEQNSYMLGWMYSSEQIAKDIERGAQYYILTIDGKDVGYTSIELVDPTKKLFKLHKIYLMHEFHGRGLGKFQLSEMVSLASSQGGTRMELNVNRNNKAVEFYQSQGWKIVRQEDNHIGNNYYMNDHVLEKILE